MSESDSKPFHHQQEKLGDDEIDALFGIPKPKEPTPKEEPEPDVVDPVDAMFGFSSLPTSKAASPTASSPHANAPTTTTNSNRQLEAMDDLVKRSSTMIEESQSGMIVAEEGETTPTTTTPSSSNNASLARAPLSSPPLSEGGRATQHHVDPAAPSPSSPPTSHSRIRAASLSGPGKGRKKGTRVGHLTKTFTMKASSVFDTLGPPPSAESDEPKPSEEEETKAQAKERKKKEEELVLKHLPEIMNMPMPLRCDFCIKFDSVCSQCHFKWKELLAIKSRALQFSIGGMPEPEIVVMMFGTVAKGTTDFLKVLMEVRPNGVHWISNFKGLRGESEEVREQLSDAGRVFPLHVACAYGKAKLANVLLAAKTPIRRSEYRSDPINMIPRSKRESRIVEHQQVLAKKEKDQRLIEEEDELRYRAKLGIYRDEHAEMNAEERAEDDEKKRVEEEEILAWEKDKAEKAAQEAAALAAATESENGGGNSQKQSGLSAEEEALSYIQSVTSSAIGGQRCDTDEDLDEEDDADDEPVEFDPDHEIRLTEEWEKMLAKHNQCRLFFTLEKAKSLRKERNYAAALDLYDDCLKLWPGSEGALCGLAKMQFDQSSYSKCIKQCDVILATRSQVDWVEFSPETIMQLRENALQKRHEVFHDLPGPALKECGCVSTSHTVISFRRLPMKLIQSHIVPFCNSYDNYRIYLGIKNPLLQKVVEEAAARSCDSSTGFLLANDFGYEQMYESIRTDHPESGRIFGKFEKFLGIQVVAMGDFHTFIVRAGTRVVNPKYRAKKKSSSWFGKDKDDGASNEPSSMVATKLFRIHRYGVGARAWEVQDSGEWEVADASLDLGQ